MFFTKEKSKTKHRRIVLKMREKRKKFYQQPMFSGYAITTNFYYDKKTGLLKATRISKRKKKIKKMNRRQFRRKMKHMLLKSMQTNIHYEFPKGNYHKKYTEFLWELY